MDHHALEYYMDRRRAHIHIAVRFQFYLTLLAQTANAIKYRMNFDSVRNFMFQLNGLAKMTHTSEQTNSNSAKPALRKRKRKPNKSVIKAIYFALKNRRIFFATSVEE